MKMKNVLLLMVALLSLSRLGNAQIHQWKLNGDLKDAMTEKSGVVAGDGNISYVDDPEKGKVLKLDGSAYVSLPDSLFQNVSDFTITCWYKFDGNDAGNWQHVYSFGSNNTNEPWNIIYYTPNDGALSRFTFGSHGNWQDITKADTTRNKWEFVKLVKKGQSLLAYKNGELYGRIDTLTSDIFKGSGIFPDTANNIGASWWGDKNFHGLVSDLRIYNEALVDMPVNWWPLKSDITDHVTGKVGTTVGDGSISYVNDPEKGQVLKLDGSAYVALPDSLFENINDFTITCWYKFDGKDAGNWQHVYSFGSNNKNEPWNIIYYTPNDGALSRFTFGSHGNWQDITKADTTRNQWEFIKLVKKGQSLFAYKNDELYGRIDTLTSDIFKGSGIFPDTANNIGASWWGDKNYHGLVSDLRIYNKAIGGSDIVPVSEIRITANIVKKDTFLVATVLPENATVKDVKWSINVGTKVASLNENTGKLKIKGDPNDIVVTASSKDGSGVVNKSNFAKIFLANRWKLTGDLTDAVTGKTGSVVGNGDISYADDANKGKVLKLDGSAYVALPDSLFEKINDFTVTCWYKYDGWSGGNWQHVYSFGNNPAGAMWHILYYTPNDNNGTSRFTFNGNGSWQDLMVKDTAESTNHWDSIAIVKKGNSLIAFKNGVLYGRIDTLTAAGNNGMGLFPDTANNIGASWWGDQNFHGLVSDLRIYSAAIMPTMYRAVWPDALTLAGEDAVVIDSSIMLTATFAPANVTVNMLKWSSSDKTIASVTNGKIKGKTAGKVTITAMTTDGSGISATKEITVKEGVSVGQIANAAFSVYPNPASKQIRISLANNANAEVQIVSITGAVVMTKVMNASSASINIGQLAKGLYMVRVSSANGTEVQKLLIK